MPNEEDGPTVLVPVAYYGCPDYLRRAVDSVLGQSYPNVRVVVVNDADPQAPWPLLADIDDPRLWRVEFTRNSGAYFAISAVLLAARADYLLIQDADDWSEPGRVRVLLDALRRSGRGMAASAQKVHYADGRHYRDGSPRGTHIENSATRLHRAATEEYYMPCNHHGLFRTDYLRRLGGYYGGFRYSYDGLIMAASHALGEITYVEESLYNRLRRPFSLTTRPETANGSPARNAIDDTLAGLYRSLFAALHEDPAAAAHPHTHLLALLPDDDRRKLEAHAGQIAAFLREPSPAVRRVTG
ncbi:glycosyltransferase family 2 protein [Streptacidiphilus sp. PB12-B1b]|uniref:glycosyltransferase family 2 protein n=1 Tax=Streptacidiphilus sp. PB12-B1b TaxID=2705012 RepID=UPI0015FD37A9|nr:glycosyltransferase family 2 protein [Streptacidiphilus sp. PB12-B1b]QMU78228.1 glycosyltransferase family 2 protein [Streptacidiphilus sp. PB12-B1b]